jgi:YidC/Oxa1 family membrane protein insertase
LHLVLAANWLLDPIVAAMGQLVAFINTYLPPHNLGLSLVVLALLVRLAFWPLNAKQFQSMIAMQKVAPKLKKLQERYKSDQTKLQQETMALYKSEGVNPFAGCLPLLIQYPFIISVFYLVINHKDVYANTAFLWVGSFLSAHSPMLFGVPLFASSLAHSDALLIVLYALSMYISVRFGSMPATDPAQAQTQKMMAVMSPLMLGFFGWKYQWPSAMVLYWFSSNVFQMGQQFYMLRRFHEPLSFLDSSHVITDDVPPEPAKPAKKLPGGNGPAKTYKVKKKTKGA